MQFPIYNDHGSSMRNKIAVFSDYKFVFAFENNNVTDYVTEKIMNVFQAGAVPVYMGAPNIQDWIPGKNSILRTDDFSSPKELAKRIQRLCDDDREYSRMLEWKKVGFSPQFIEKTNNCFFYGAECRLCQYVLEQRKKLSSVQKSENDKRRASNLHHYYALEMNMVHTPQYVQVDPSPALALGNEFSLGGWILPQNTDMPILEAHSFQVELKQLNGKTFLRFCTSQDCWWSSHVIQPKVWSHFSIHFHYNPNPARSFIHFFVNGVKDETVETPLSFPSSPPSDLPFFIGTNAKKDTFFKGALDDFVLWNRTLGDQEARQMTWQIPSETAEKLIAYWSFNQIPSDELLEAHGYLGRISGNPTWIESRERRLVTVKPCL